MPRKKGNSARVHTGIRLDAKIVERLSESGRGLSEEIRERIERTLEWDSHDEATRDLAAVVMWLADEVSRQSDLPWHSNPNAQQALATAIQSWLEIIAPLHRGAVSDLFGPGDPTTLGKAIARHHQRFKAEMEKNTAELLSNLRKGDKS